MPVFMYKSEKSVRPETNVVSAMQRADVPTKESDTLKVSLSMYTVSLAWYRKNSAVEDSLS